MRQISTYIRRLLKANNYLVNTNEASWPGNSLEKRNFAFVKLNYQLISDADKVPFAIYLLYIVNSLMKLF